MSNSDSIPQLDPQFDEFLFAPIDDGRNEMPLSVLSALARLDFDPWQEAANLAQLPREVATERLATLIAALPGKEGGHSNLEAIAARLTALLPRQADAHVGSRERSLSDDPIANSGTVIRVILINVVFVAFLLGAQSIIASHSPPARTDVVHPPASAPAVPHLPPPDWGK
jgi:hypothetical protein